MPDEDFSLFDNLRGLITLVDQLRDIGVGDYISLPRIAVLGTQSAGKSSLLEHIVGMDFLPRGSGVVTRRPLELRMVRKKELARPYAVFKGYDNQKLEDFDKILNVIKMLTDRVCGEKKGIVDDAIVMTVYSPTCPDLTIVDLPGITKIAVGDQPNNIGELTTNMVTRYCQDKRTVI